MIPRLMRLLMIPMALAGLGLATRCGHDEAPPPPVLIGAAAPTGPKATVPATGNGFADGDDWPNACDLVTDQELQAILPQVTAIKRVPDDKQIQPIDLSLHSAPSPFVARNAWCQYAFELPRSAGDLVVDEEVVGTPDVVDANWRADAKHASAATTSINGAECRVAGGAMDCRTSAVYYNVYLELDTQYADETSDSEQMEQYQAAGQVHKFSRTGQSTTPEESEFLATVVMPEFAKTVNAKLT